MKNFISYANQFRAFLAKIVQSEDHHARWINTLSYLENCGARKIARCEHPTLVREEVLKHASEEFRHAHYLKKQIARVSSAALDDYSQINLLGGTASLNYLNALDVKASRYLIKEAEMPKEEVKKAAYILVTYAIELRAAELYPIYDRCLREIASKVTVKSLVLEEQEHLLEMEEGLSKLPHGAEHANRICSIEGELCRSWIQALL